MSTRKYYYLSYFDSRLILVALEPTTPVPRGLAGPASPLTHKQSGKRKRSETDFDPFAIDPGPKRKRLIKMDQFNLLMKLDVLMDPGLTTRQLKMLLTRCECGLTMTKRVYDDHQCMLDDEVIDLTTLLSDVE